MIIDHSFFQVKHNFLSLAASLSSNNTWQSNLLCMSRRCNSRRVEGLLILCKHIIKISLIQELSNWQVYQQEQNQASFKCGVSLVWSQILWWECIQVFFSPLKPLWSLFPFLLSRDRWVQQGTSSYIFSNSPNKEDYWFLFRLKMKGHLHSWIFFSNSTAPFPHQLFVFYLGKAWPLD
jgi:hypothetical protein